MLQINDALVEKWEPKVHQMLRDRYVAMEYDDACQALRLSIIKAAKHFDKAAGVSFHTYLHVIMAHDINSINERARKKNILTEPLVDTVKSQEDDFDDSTVSILMAEKRLNAGEAIILDLLMCGYTKRELVSICTPTSDLPNLLKSLKTKFIDLLVYSSGKRRGAKRKWLPTKVLGVSKVYKSTETISHSL